MHVNPKNTPSTHPICGEKLIKLRKRMVAKCKKYGLAIDKQFCGAINIYLSMCGVPQSPSTFYSMVSKPLTRLMKRRIGALMRALGGFATYGVKDIDMLLMNPRGGLSSIKPKAYIGLPTPM